MSADPTHQDDNSKKAPTLWETIKSVNAAFIGVQSSRNRERDFTKGKPVHFIAIGIVMTIVFIFVVMFFVKLALKNAGL